MTNLRDIALYMANVGHNRGALKNYQTGAVCMLGAAVDLKITEPDSWDSPSIELLGDVIEELYPERINRWDDKTMRVASFSDHRATTIADIQRVCDVAQSRV